MSIQPVRWQNQTLSIIDQTLLPGELRYITLDSLERVWEAITKLRVRGAPAIGVCAAFGVLAGLREKKPGSLEAAHQTVCESAAYLATSRPTAVNLFWALDRMQSAAAKASGATVEEFFAQLESEAIAIYEEDIALCRAIGKHGASLIEEGRGVLTHCNAGGLATTGYGTALAPMYTAHASGVRFEVYAGETRPLLQGARLTAWELLRAGISTTLICDNTAAQVMREGKIHLVIVGADRIAANGDAANKIGTYSLAVLARAHDIPFYVAAPYSTFDFALPNGEGIPIEQRAAEEVTRGFGKATAPEPVRVYSPAFDVTPAELITGIITESGILGQPLHESISTILRSGAKTGQPYHS